MPALHARTAELNTRQSNDSSSILHWCDHDLDDSRASHSRVGARLRRRVVEQDSLCRRVPHLTHGGGGGGSPRTGMRMVCMKRGARMQDRCDLIWPDLPQVL
jgi:hypothetical protein